MPERVPDEWVEAAAFALRALRLPGPDFNQHRAEAALAAVLPLVAVERDRAVRDALDEAVRRIEATPEHWNGLLMAARIVADLRDGAR